MVCGISRCGAPTLAVKGSPGGAAGPRTRVSMCSPVSITIHASRAGDTTPRGPPLWSLAPDTTVVHLDLPPQDIILASRGPVIIDW